jgi:uncharacterized protein (TIGR03435 family)
VRLIVIRVAGAALFLLTGCCFAEEPFFEAASVKVTNIGGGGINGGPGTSDPRRFYAPHVRMYSLLSRAYDVIPDQIAGPAWLHDMWSDDGIYEVIATMPVDTTKEQFRQMLQNLLIERFHLVIHHETRNFPGYNLVVARGGPKLKEVTPTADGHQESGSHRGIQQQMKYQEWTMAEFAQSLGYLIGAAQGRGGSGYFQPRVADKTALTAKYTFTLSFYQESRDPSASFNSGGLPDILTAIQDQLGLRLVKTADVPVDVIVVDSVDKIPVAN